MRNTHLLPTIFFPGLRRTKAQVFVSHESIIFLLYSLNPLGIFESLGDSVWLSDSWNYGGEAIFWV